MLSYTGTLIAILKHGAHAHTKIPVHDNGNDHNPHTGYRYRIGGVENAGTRPRAGSFTGYRRVKNGLRHLSHRGGIARGD